MRRYGITQVTQSVRLRYRFKKPRWVILFTLLDFVGEVARRVLSLFWNIWRRDEPPEPHRILVVRLDHIGDVLLSTPALDALRSRFPHAHITALVGPWAAEVVREHPAVDEVQVYAAPWFDRGRRYRSLYLLLSLLTGARRLRAHRFDIGIDLRGDFRNLVLLTLAGVRYRVSYADTGGGFLLNRVVATRKYQHEVQRNLDVVRSLGADNAFPMPSLAVSDEDRNLVARLLARHGVGNRELLIAIHPGAGEPSRLWRAERFAAVGNALARRWGAKLVLTGSVSDAALVDDIKQGLQAPFLNLAGALTLKQLAALLERCTSLITVNTGPMHIAAAVGTPLVVAFSSSNTLDEWHPFDPSNSLTTNPSASTFVPRASSLMAQPSTLPSHPSSQSNLFGGKHIAIQKLVPCLGCELEVCPKRVRCMDLIMPEEVLAAAESQLRRHWLPRQAPLEE